MSDEENQPYILFKGCTRLPLVQGVPMYPLGAMLMVVAITALMLSLWWWFSAIPLFFIMRAITASDDKKFRIIELWLDTKVRNRNKKFWKSSSYSHVQYKRDLK